MPPPPSTIGRQNYYPSQARAWAAGWDYATARAAIDAHKRGYFVGSYQLAIDMLAHPAIKAARDRRVAAAVSLPWTISGPDRAPGRLETDAARALWPQVQRLHEDVVDDLAMHGLCILQHPVELVETDRGPRYVVTSVETWPIACIEHGSALMSDADAGPYDPDRYYARVAGGKRVRLPRPGETDLHWTVIGVGDRPHLRGAIASLDMAFVAGQLGRRAMARLLNTIGRASPIGELPEGAQMTNADGTESRIASDMLEVVTALGETQAAAIHPKGSRIYPFEVTAQTGSLFPDWHALAVREIQWAILGHDRAIAEGDQYTDPTTQSIPQDATRRDVGCIERAVSSLFTGIARLNAERCAPIEVRGHLPDADQAERRKADDDHAAAQLAAGKAAAEQLAAERAAGAVVDDARVAQVYEIAGVPPPAMAPAKPQGDAVYAYDLDGGIVTINEQRAAKGLPAVEWGAVTVPEYSARVAAGWTTSPAGWVQPAPAAPSPTPAPTAAA